MVERLGVEARVSSTNRADMDLTETGDFCGNIFATGLAPIGDGEARFVVTDVPGAGTKMMARFQYEAGSQSTPPKKRCSCEKRPKKRRWDARRPNLP
ncbi:hypothetical protein [Mycobacterium heckeshornense]|uniref:hypothetical protein n=1 Tax=Mycobacterium heckeshornense TaxID=110505 RepID=UPI000671D924|nr:hypothetical protein [Mycobacterium heckeshornense]KMV23879.1 hypothetical protein ACT16_03170 [Mycobacterium heckeshornense]MCV7033405.1 hypothetical protein [Mycobacterium heckeshornense]